MQIRPLICLILLCSSLGACVNNSLYSSAARTGYGYSEEKIADKQYRVRFVVRGDKPEVAKEHVLLRAAELCLAESHSWFRVLDTSSKVVYDNKIDPSQLMPADIDPLGGNFDLPRYGNGEHTIAKKGTELGLGKTTSMVIAELEIRMLMGERLEGANVYSARDTYKQLKQKLVTEKSSYH